MIEVRSCLSLTFASDGGMDMVGWSSFFGVFDGFMIIIIGGVVVVVKIYIDFFLGFMIFCGWF